MERPQNATEIDDDQVATRAHAIREIGWNATGHIARPISEAGLRPPDDAVMSEQVTVSLPAADWRFVIERLLIGGSIAESVGHTKDAATFLGTATGGIGVEHHGEASARRRRQPLTAALPWDHVLVADASIEVSTTRVARRGDRRRFRRHVHETLAHEVANSGQVVIEIEGGRLRWRWTRRRLRRSHGVDASRLGPSTWILHGRARRW